MFIAVSIAQAKPKCAVLPFKAKAGFTQEEADLLCNSYRDLLRKSGKYEIMSQNDVNVMIKTRLSHRAASLTPYYVIVGRTIKADYIITGSVEATTDALWLNTALCDVKKQRINRRIKVFYRGDVDEFMRIAPKSSIERLFRKSTTQPTQGAVAQKPALTPKKTIAKPKIASTPKVQKKPTKTSSKPRDYGKTLRTIGDYTHNNLQVGLRMSYYKLIDNENEAFLGSINQLKEDQDYTPHLFARIRLPMELFWISLGYNKLRAKTWTTAGSGSDPEGYTDGTIELSGPFVLLHFHSEREKDLQWFGEVGFAIYKADFIHNPAWRDARGHVDSHIMNFYDTYGLMLNGGCEFYATDNITLSTYISYTRVDVDMTYYLYDNKVRDSSFPLSNFGLGLGVQYRF